MELLRGGNDAGEVGKCVWYKACRRVVWCPWTSASICCELRGPAGIWGWEGGDLLPSASGQLAFSSSLIPLAGAW